MGHIAYKMKAKISARAAFVVRLIQDAHAALRVEADLSPRNPRVNQTLSRLVGTLSEPYNAREEREILDHPHVQQVRQELLGLLNRSEFEMEQFWADYFNGCENLNEQTLQEFWYWRNYCDLVDVELEELERHGFGEDSSVVFVGAGPLPLSAIIMHQRTGCRVTCVDVSPEACAKSRQLIEKLGLDDVIDVVESNGMGFDYAGYDLAFVAAMVPEKERVIAKASDDNPECLIAVRSAEGVHEVLYEPYEEHKLLSKAFGLASAGRSRTVPDIINTTNFYRKRSYPHKPF
jgi:protein-L-isoaspartate O-methyltransferase